MSKGQAAFETLLFTYADLFTDGLMVFEYFSRGRTFFASLMASVLGFSLVLQGLVAHFCGQGA